MSALGAHEVVEAAAFRNENTIEIAAAPADVWPWLTDRCEGKLRRF